MATYYVSATGSDSNNGTSSSTPWKSLVTANSRIGTGDTVRVLAGTYHERLVITKANTTWVNWPAGAVWGPVLDGYYSRSFLGSNGWKMPSPLNGGPNGNWLPYITTKEQYDSLVDINASGVTFDGFFVRNSAQEGISTTRSNITVQNCRVDFTRARGIRVVSGISGKVSGVVIRNNVVTHTGMRRRDGIGPDGSSMGQCQNSSGTIWEYNTFCYGAADGFILNDSNDNAIVRYNVIHTAGGGVAMDENSVGAKWYGNIIGTMGPSIYEFGSGPALLISRETQKNPTYAPTTTIWYNNIFFNSGILVKIRQGSEADTILLNSYFGFNTFIAGPNTNTFIDAPTNQFRNNVHHGIFENNIFYGNAGFNVGSGMMGNVRFRNNIWSITPPSWAQGTGSSYATNPLLVAPTAALTTTGTKTNANYQTSLDPNNYKIQDSSPAKNAASNGSTFNGVTPPSVTEDYFRGTRSGSKDIGAHEFDGSPTTPNTVTASFTCTPTLGIAPLSVAFTNASSYTGSFPITDYSWDFGDGTTSTATNPTKIYTVAGSYQATLTVTANSGALISIFTGPTITVQAAPPPPPEETGSEAYAAVCTGTMPTSNTTMTLSGDLHGITPKAVELYVAGVTADDTPTAGNIFGVGMTDGSTHYAAAIHAVDNVSPTVARRRWTTSKALLLIKSDGTVMASATFNSWTADGVVLNVVWEAGTTPTAYKVTGMLHGGPDLRAKVSIVTLGNAGTSQTVSPGFTPQLIKVAATFGAADTANNEAIISLGVAGASGNQFALSRRVRTGTGTADTSAQLLAQVATLRFATGERGNAFAENWTATGVTISVTDFDNIGSSAGVLLLNYGALRSSVTTLVSPASPGTASVTLGWQPQAVQHLLSIIGAVGTTWNTGTRTGAVGVHLRDVAGGYSVLSLSQDDQNPSNENASRDTAFSVRSGAAASVVAGTTSLTGTGYEIELSAVDSITLAFPCVAVEAAPVIEETPEMTADWEILGDNPGLVPLQVAFFDRSVGDNAAVAWRWDFGDGTTSTQQHPVKVYDEPGTFTVSLTVQDALGTTDTLEREDYLVVEGESLLDDEELIIGPLIPLADIGAIVNDVTRVNAIRAPENDEPAGTIQFRLNVETELRFANGWAIVADEDGILRIRKDDDSLWDFDLTAV